MRGIAIETERLLLRSWCAADRTPFAEICADPRVMATPGPVMDRAASDALLDRVEVMEAAHGHTFWALERKGDAAWAITHTGNARSRAVMERLGMRHHPELDFDHPRIAEGDPLRRHVACSVNRSDWAAR